MIKHMSHIVSLTHEQRTATEERLWNGGRIPGGWWGVYSRVDFFFFFFFFFSEEA